MKQSYGAIWGLVLKQASMQSFVDTFRALGVVFLLVIPMLLLMKKPTGGAGPGAGMH
jgi:DHA2 family multidrug resistance protein